ncbi:MAG TPA: 2-phospho-L-lactate transferase [Gaiellales bacterium]
MTLLAGGVGGARFARGLVAAVEPAGVTIVGNVGDDVELLGLHVSPDLDTVMYTLAGRIDPVNGWGVAGDTREAQTAAIELGGSDWFILGDRDIGLHLVRSERLRAGEPLSSITADLARRIGLAVALLPATDDPLRTRIGTDAGELEFQQWLVGRRAADAVREVRFDGLPARPAPGVLDAIGEAEVIVLAPSNPFVSLDPILAVDGVREAVVAARERVVAISPIIAGKAVKGPLAGMLETLGPEPGAVGVARLLAPFAAAFLLDEADAALVPQVEALGMRAILAPSLMRDLETSRALAEAAIAPAAR